MAKENSFLNYIQNKHESEIINRCLGFLVKHKYVVENKIKRSFSSTFDYEHEDISFKNVYIDSKGNGNIEFDVIVGYSVSFEIVEGKYHDHDRDEVDDIWLTVSCSGLVGETLKNFKITHVDEFNKNKPRKPMDGELVPIIGKSQFNEIAEDILFKYYPEVLDKPSPTDPLVLAERLGLLVEKHNLSSDNSIFGQIYFKTTKTKIFDNNVEEEIEAKENTIFYDEHAAFLFSVGSKNLTIAHEIVHAFLHREAFFFSNMYNKDFSYISCESSGGIRGNVSEKTAWMEAQANGIAPYLLMPEKTFLAKAKELFDLYKQVRDYSDRGYISKIIDDLADFFHVTRYAAKKRLAECGYSIAIGAYNYVDDKYVRPYKFKKGSLNEGETFTLSEKDIYEKAYQNFELLKGFTSGKLAVVENHIVKNNSKYVREENEKILLTDYALDHMDECCIKFKIESKNNLLKEDVPSFCYLCKDVSKKIEFTVSFGDNRSLLSDPEFATAFIERNKEARAYIKELEDLDLNACICYIHEKSGMEAPTVARRYGKDERTVRRYLEKGSKPDNKYDLAKLCRAYRLNPIVSEYVIQEKGGYHLGSTSEDDAIRIMLLTMEKYKVEEVDSFLENIRNN